MNEFSQRRTLIMKCPKCGVEVKPGTKFCGKCGYMFSDIPTPPTPTPPKPGPGPIDFRVNRMPQGIALGVGERIVKQYRIGRYTFRQGSIDVVVTNKRVIRYEESSLFGLQNNQIDEINIDAVHGVTTHMRRSISILGIVFALVFLIVGFCGLFARISYYKSAIEYAVGTGALAIAVIIIVSSLKPTLFFSVLGSVGNTALGTIVNSRGRLFRNDGNSIIFQFKPTAETTDMLKEIGACIYDLKTLGDKAIDKWH